MPSTPTPQPGQVRERRRVYGPHVIKLARFLQETATPPGDVVNLLVEIDRRWPGLSFNDFVGAAVLADALAMQTEDNA